MEKNEGDWHRISKSKLLSKAEHNEDSKKRDDAPKKWYRNDRTKKARMDLKPNKPHNKSARFADMKRVLTTIKSNNIKPFYYDPTDNEEDKNGAEDTNKQETEEWFDALQNQDEEEWYDAPQELDKNNIFHRLGGDSVFEFVILELCKNIKSDGF